MPQKPITESVSLMCAFNQSGNVSNHKRPKVTEIDDTQVWFERSKRIIGNLRFRRRHCGDERGFACVWKSHQSDVGQKFQFELQLKLFTRTSFLMITRRAIRRGRKMRVAKPAASTAGR